MGCARAPWGHPTALASSEGARVGASGWESAVGGRSSGWIGADRRRAQFGVLGRWWAGWPASPQTSRLSPSPVGRFWTAPTPIRALVAPRIPTASLGGATHLHRPSWWHLASPPRVVVAPRIPTTHLGGTPHPHLARIGVGAVQNRRPDHRVLSTVCGDAGRPAHQRSETPPCARHRHAPISTPLHHHNPRFPPRRVPQKM
jgi:hypothetical protein